MSGSRGVYARQLMWAPPENRARASRGAGAPTVGQTAASRWASGRGIRPPAMLRWHVEIALDVHDHPAAVEFDDKTASRFHIDVYSEEWGVFFCHGGRASWIRITDIAFVHGRDDHSLLALVPPLDRVGDLLRRLEQMYQLRFRRDHALIRTNLPGIAAKVRTWVEAL